MIYRLINPDGSPTTVTYGNIYDANYMVNTISRLTGLHFSHRAEELAVTSSTTAPTPVLPRTPTTPKNSVCVHIETAIGPDNTTSHFMDVTAPQYVNVKIDKHGTVWVNVNESCIFRLCKAGELRVENDYINPK